MKLKELLDALSAAKLSLLKSYHGIYKLPSEPTTVIQELEGELLRAPSQQELEMIEEMTKLAQEAM